MCVCRSIIVAISQCRHTVCTRVWRIKPHTDIYFTFKYMYRNVKRWSVSTYIYNTGEVDSQHPVMLSLSPRDSQDSAVARAGWPDGVILILFLGLREKEHCYAPIICWNTKKLKSLCFAPCCEKHPLIFCQKQEWLCPEVPHWIIFSHLCTHKHEIHTYLKNILVVNERTQRNPRRWECKFQQIKETRKVFGEYK